MLVQSVLTLLFAPLVAGQCSVCGDGLSVTKPKEIFAFPGQPVVECGQLETAGKDGTVPLNQCGFLPPLIKDTCGCRKVDGCSVCGEGKKVSKPDEIFAFPQQPVVACGALENAGRTGIVPLNECGFLPGLIADICGCIPESQAIPPTRPPVSDQMPFVPPTQNTQAQRNSKNGLPTGAVVGIIIGVVAVGGLLIGLVFISTSKMRKEQPIITAEATAVTAAPAPPADAFGTGDAKTAIDDKEMI